MTRAPSFIPILSAGRHRSPRRGACFMEFASYLAGERWSDHPACTHPLLAALARDVNDLTSDASRDALMPLVPRVIGLESDDPRVPARIALHAAAAAMPVASAERQQALAVGMLEMITDTDDPALAELGTRALASAPIAERWARDYLRRPHPARRADRACFAMVHTAAIGIGLACVSDADARLRALLEAAIAGAETVVRNAPEPELQLA